MIQAIGELTSNFIESEEGATSAENGVIIVVVAGIALFAVRRLDNNLDGLYDRFTVMIGSRVR